mgnify:FL=1
MKDYDISLKVRCESKPETWIVDCLYDQLNQKINEDILYWQVKEIIKEGEPIPPNPPEEK